MMVSFMLAVSTQTMMNLGKSSAHNIYDSQFIMCPCKHNSKVSAPERESKPIRAEVFVRNDVQTFRQVDGRAVVGVESPRGKYLP